MKLFCIVPVKDLRNIKRRLSGILTARQRRELSLCMLEDVLRSAVTTAAVDRCLVVSPDVIVISRAKELGADALLESRARGVNSAVRMSTRYCMRQGADATLVLPADVPLISPLDIDQIVRLGRHGRCVILSPSSRLDGTNALLRRPPDVIRTSYESDSFDAHMRLAIATRIKLEIYLSKRIVLDIDTPADLLELRNTPSATRSYRYLTGIQLQKAYKT